MRVVTCLLSASSREEGRIDDAAASHHLQSARLRGQDAPMWLHWKLTPQHHCPVHCCPGPGRQDARERPCTCCCKTQQIHTRARYGRGLTPSPHSALTGGEPSSAHRGLAGSPARVAAAPPSRRERGEHAKRRVWRHCAAPGRRGRTRRHRANAAFARGRPFTRQ